MSFLKNVLRRCCIFLPVLLLLLGNKAQAVSPINWHVNLCVSLAQFRLTAGQRYELLKTPWPVQQFAKNSILSVQILTMASPGANLGRSADQAILVFDSYRKLIADETRGSLDARVERLVMIVDRKVDLDDAKRTLVRAYEEFLKTNGLEPEMWGRAGPSGMAYAMHSSSGPNQCGNGDDAIVLGISPRGLKNQ